jgi:hypothetical protein
MALTNYEKKLRYLARKRGEYVEPLPAGPPRGYRQAPEHIAKRSRWGADHHAWKGSDVLPRSARARATRRFRDLGPCGTCGAVESESHHIDRDPTNNEPANIAILCHPCHMALHWRQGDFA